MTDQEVEIILTPGPRHPTYAELQPLVYRWSQMHPSGGAFHIVLEDGNIQQSHVDWCREQVTEGDLFGYALGLLLSLASRRTRERLYHYWGWCQTNDVQTVLRGGGGA